MNIAFESAKWLWGKLCGVSVLSDTKDKLVAVYDAVSGVYGVCRQMLKTGEAILSKIALSGVSVSCLTAAGFFTLLQTGLSKLLAAMRSISDGLSSGASGGSADVISNINYYLPVDTLATVILLYVSLWVAVGTFKFWTRMIGFLVGGRRAASKG